MLITSIDIMKRHSVFMGPGQRLQDQHRWKLYPQPSVLIQPLVTHVCVASGVLCLIYLFFLQANKHIPHDVNMYAHLTFLHAR